MRGALVVLPGVSPAGRCSQGFRGALNPKTWLCVLGLPGPFWVSSSISEEPPWFPRQLIKQGGGLISSRLFWLTALGLCRSSFLSGSQAAAEAGGYCPLELGSFGNFPASKCWGCQLEHPIKAGSWQEKINDPFSQKAICQLLPQLLPSCSTSCCPPASAEPWHPTLS